MTDKTPMPIAPFENWQLNRLTLQQKSDAARQFLDNGFTPEQVEKVFGRPDLTPSEAMKQRAARASYLREHWTGDRAALETALKRSGL